MGIWLGAVVVALCAISVKVHGPVRVLVVHIGFARILPSSPSLPLSAEVRRRAADIIAAIVGASARHAEQQALAEQQAALQAAGVF